MRIIYFTLLTLLAGVFTLNAQQRSTPNFSLEPFYHGVASGDPTDQSVIIWTRVTTDSASVDVRWRVALDTGMTQIVQQGIVTTDTSRDHTVKVDITGLQPFTYYFYEFTAYGKNSLRGRTRTLPTGANVAEMRFAVVSCARYTDGYFNAYRHITTRNDVFGVIHLGDYIYEYATGGNRPVEPTYEILTLSDYRVRYSHYKLDEDLIRLHQQYPFICVWDDHETANDSWVGGAQNHDPATEGDWFQRKAWGQQVYLEWMPIRTPDPVGHPTRIYRRFDMGDLMTLHMMDTRLEGRDVQDGTTNTDPNRTILGHDQYDWLTTGMTQSAAKWQVLGQQVMMAPLRVFGTAINPDQWDGYPAERQRLWDYVTDPANSIENMVVLTGDIHSAWANDLPMSNYVASSGANSVGVEFVCTSITSLNSVATVSSSIITNLNPHIKYAHLSDHGYCILDVNTQRALGEWWAVDDITQISNNVNFRTAWQTVDGSRHLSAASQSTASPAFVGQQAPLAPRALGTGTVSAKPFIMIGAFPNPFKDFIDVQFYNTLNQEPLILNLTDASGRLILSAPLKNESGTNEQRIPTMDLPMGTYYLTILSGSKVVSTKVLKI